MSTEYVSIDSSSDNTPVSRARSAVSNAASSAGTTVRVAADGARSAFRDLVTSKAPPLQVDWSPLLPRSGLSLTERVIVARENIKPWSLFASAKALSFPKSPGQIKPRYVQNISRFFYNYLVLALADIAISGVFHRVDAVITIALIILLYIAFEDDIELFGGSVTIGSRVKASIVTISFSVTLVFGGVIPYVFHSFVFATLLFAVHGLFRITEDEEAADIESAAAYPDDSIVFDANNPTVETVPTPTDF